MRLTSKTGKGELNKRVIYRIIECQRPETPIMDEITKNTGVVKTVSRNLMTK